METISRSKDAYLTIIWPDIQESLEAPFTLSFKGEYYVIVGKQDSQEVELIIPKHSKCYFEIRPTEV